VVSWAILRGRCRASRSPISARYPAVELLTAALFAVTFLLGSGLSPSLPSDLAFVAALIALVFIDAEHMILPDAITLPGAAIALLARALVPNLYGVRWLEATYDGAPAWLLSVFWARGSSGSSAGSGSGSAGSRRWAWAT
jgi:leader peptidase (prepilin peptidase)/N-methyltransferase